MSSNPSRVLIVGGGFGGLAAAKALRKTPAHITLIDRNNHHVFQPLLYQVATSVLTPGQIAAPIRAILRKQCNATVILGEVTGYASSTVASPEGRADIRQAIENVLRASLERAGIGPEQVGHVHAHGLATRSCDRDEAAALAAVFGERRPPVVAAKSFMGNLGAGSGIVETVASLQALAHDRLFAIRNYQEPDPECDILAARPDEHSPGDCFVNVNVTNQGQACAIVVRKVTGAETG